MKMRNLTLLRDLPSYVLFEADCPDCRHIRKFCFKHDFKKKAKSMQLKTTSTTTKTEDLQQLVERSYTYGASEYHARLLELLIKKNLIDLPDLKYILHGDQADQYNYEIVSEEPAFYLALNLGESAK